MLEAGTLREAVATFLRESEYKGHTSATVRNKRQMYYQFLSYCGDRPFCAETIQDFLYTMRARDLSVNTVRTAVNLLRILVHHLVAKGIIVNDFSEELIMPKEKSKELHLLSMELTEKVIMLTTKPGKGDNSRNRRIKLEEYRPALKLALRTGVRNAEIRSIKGSDLHLDAETPVFMVHSKGGQVEPVPVPLDMLAFLRTRKDRERVFEVSAGILNDVLARGCKKLGLHPINFHDLRHTFATHLLTRGVPIQLVSRILRHKNVLITDKYYSHYVVGDLSRAMNANHDLIKVGISDDIMAEYVRKALEQIGINTNNITIDLEHHAFSGKW